MSIKTSVAATGVENGLDSVAMPPPPVKKGPLGYLHAILRGKQEREEKKKEKEREGRSSSQADARTHGAEQNSLHLELKTSHSSMCAISTSASPVAVLVSKNIHAKSDRTMIGDPRNHTTTSSSTDTSAASGTATTAGSEMKFDFDPSMMSPAQFSHLARQEKHFLLSKINEREQGMVDVDDVNDEMTGCKSASDGEKSEAGEGDTLIDVDNREKTSDRLSSMLSSSETKSGKDIHLTVSLDNGGGNGSVNIIKIEQANDRTSCANSSGEKFKNDEDAHDTSEKEKKEVKEENEEIEIMRCDSPTNSTFPMLTSRLTFAKQQEKQRHKQASSTRARFSLSSLSSLQALNFSPNCFPMNNESTNPNSKNMPTSKNYKCGDTKNTNNRSGNRLQRGHSYHQHQHQHQFHFSPFSLQPMKAPPSLPPSLSPSLSSSTAPVSEFGAFAPVGAGTDAGGTSTKRGAGTESAETFEVKDLDVTAEALDVPSPLQKCLNTERAGHCSRGHIEMGIQGSECDDAARKDKDRSEAGEGGKDEPEEGGEAADDNTASKARLCVGDFELLNVVGRGAYGTFALENVY